VTPLARALEALLFLAPDPVAAEELADALQAESAAVADALAELGTALEGRGVALREVAGGYALAARPEHEEAARSPFGAVLYRTTPLFLKLFGLRSLDELPDPAQWDPAPEEQAALRERLLRAGDERAGQ
jgi:segregation and condensation protein B